MENTNRYLTGMILAACTIVFGGFFFLRGAVKTYNQVEPDISYSMPRPKKNTLYTWLFGLEGRDVQYKEIDPFKDKQAAAGVAGGSVRKDQKNAPKIDPKKAAAKAKATATATAPKKPEVKVNVVNAAPENSLRSGGDAGGADVSAGAAAAQAAAAAAQAAAGDNANNNENNLSAAHWRALLLAQPTKDNVAKLVDAFNKKKVDAATLYLIMNDLLQSSNTDTQGAGLLLAQAVPSLKSFSAVAENYDKFSAGGKTTADAYLLTYMQPSRLSILALALKSTDAVVAHRAAQVMVTGLQQANSGGTKDPRGGRGVVATGNSNAYSQFIPILQQLIQGSDASLAGLAQSALTQIQGLSNA